MITKEKLLQSINDMPDKFSIDDVLERIVLLNKVETGLEQSQKGKTSSTKEAKENLKKWLT